MGKRVAAEEKNNSILRLETEVKEKGEEIKRLQESNTILKEKISQLNTTLEKERKATEEKLALVNGAQQKLSDTFKALSADALKDNNQSFLELAKTSLEKFQEGAKNDLEVRQKAISEMVKPVKESLEKVDVQLQELEKARLTAYTALTEQIGSLSKTQANLQTETSNLVKALRAPVVRGRWGGIQLKRVVEMAGMIEYCDFVQQEVTETEQGRLRPEMVVRLPGGKNVVIDSKVPIMAYLEAYKAQDDETRSAKLREHARQVRSHLVKLGAKSYWDQFKSSPEFVVLFLPGETFFSAALTLSIAAAMTLSKMNGIWSDIQIEEILDYLKKSTRRKVIENLRDYKWLERDGIDYKLSDKAKAYITAVHRAKGRGPRPFALLLNGGDKSRLS